MNLKTFLITILILSIISPVQANSFYNNVSIGLDDLNESYFGGTGNIDATLEWLNIDDLYTDHSEKFTNPVNIAVIDLAFSMAMYEETSSIISSIQYCDTICHTMTTTKENDWLDKGHGDGVVNTIYQILGSNANLDIYLHSKTSTTTSLVFRDIATILEVINAKSDDELPKIINMSLGVSDGINFAGKEDVYWLLADLSARGVFLVASSGNSGDEDIYFPASSPVVRSVNSFDPSSGVKRTYSTYGPGLDLTVPDGVNILQSDSDGILQNYVGKATSYASPVLVSMVAFLYMAYKHKHGFWPDSFQAINIIYEYVEPSNQGIITEPNIDQKYSISHDNNFGYGLLDIYQAIDDLLFVPPPPPVCIGRYCIIPF